MANGRFILCRTCEVVHHATSFDNALFHVCSTGETKEIPADDRRVFMDQHAGHSMEPLTALGEHYFPKGLPSDPMAVAYLKVTNGRRQFLLRRSRRSMAEPLRFEPIEGDFSDPGTVLEIQEREIRKEIRLRFDRADGQSLSNAKVDRFIALFRAAVGEVEARSFTATEPSYDNDNIAYGALPASTKDLLLKQCTGHFTPAEVQALRRFIEAHSDGSDVMTLRLRHRPFVAEPA
jgi:hypothetical protein